MLFYARAEFIYMKPNLVSGNSIRKSFNWFDSCMSFNLLLMSFTLLFLSNKHDVRFSSGYIVCLIT